MNSSQSVSFAKRNRFSKNENVKIKASESSFHFYRYKPRKAAPKDWETTFPRRERERRAHNTNFDCFATLQATGAGKERAKNKGVA